jgi:hypothetical protein
MHAVGRIRIVYLLVIISGVSSSIGWAGYHAADDNNVQGPRAESDQKEEEIVRINRAIQAIKNIAGESWASVLEQDPQGLDVTEYQKSIREQLEKATTGSVSRDELEKAYKEGLDSLRKNTIAQLWPASAEKLRVEDYYDLSNPQLPDYMQKLIRYFRDEYGQDITHTRILMGRISVQNSMPVRRDPSLRSG